MKVVHGERTDRVDGLHTRLVSDPEDRVGNTVAHEERSVEGIGDALDESAREDVRGLTLRARCTKNSSGDALTIFAETDTNNSYIRAHAGMADADMDIGEGEAIFSSADHWGGLVYRRGGSTSVDAPVVSVDWAWDTNPTGNDCQLSGTAIGT